MAVEQEETKEENKITHQPSQEEEIPREPRQGVQMYDQDLSSYSCYALKSLLDVSTLHGHNLLLIV